MSSELQTAVRAYLDLSLSQVEEPTAEETVLSQQLSTSPIGGIVLTQLLLQHPPAGIAATIVFAIFFKLMDALATLHKHHILHGNICAENIILSIPSALNVLDERAANITVHLMISCFSTIKPSAITDTQSEGDVAKLLDSIINLALKNEYCLERKIRIDYIPPVTVKPAPLLGELVRDLATMRLRQTGLEELRQKWWKRMALVLMVPGVEATQEEVEEVKAMALGALSRVLWGGTADTVG